MGESSPAYVAHSTPTRLRLRVPARRHDVAFLDELVRKLESHEHVIRAEANPLTASVTLRVRHPIDWSSLDLSAYGVAIVDGDEERPANASRVAPVRLTSASPAGIGLDPAAVIVQISSFVLTGRPLTALLQWLGERLLQSLLSRLLQLRSQHA